MRQNTDEEIFQALDFSEKRLLRYIETAIAKDSCAESLEKITDDLIKANQVIPFFKILQKTRETTLLNKLKPLLHYSVFISMIEQYCKTMIKKNTDFIQTAEFAVKTPFIHRKYYFTSSACPLQVKPPYNTWVRATALLSKVLARYADIGALLATSGSPQTKLLNAQKKILLTLAILYQTILRLQKCLALTVQERRQENALLRKILRSFIFSVEWGKTPEICGFAPLSPSR